MKVLLIDDDLWTRTVTAQALAYSGRIDVVEAASGAEGIELARRERPDCILLDLVLPDCDGTDVIDGLRAQGSDAPPVVFVTTLLDERQRLELLGRGAIAVLPKPVNLIELPSTIERLVSVAGSRSAPE